MKWSRDFSGDVGHSESPPVEKRKKASEQYCSEAFFSGGSHGNILRCASHGGGVSQPISKVLFPNVCGMFELSASHPASQAKRVLVYLF